MKNKTLIYTVLILLLGLGAYLYISRDMSSTENAVVMDENTPTNDVEYVDEEIDVAPDDGITSDDILENPELYEGVEVIVRAEVEEWLGPRAIVFDAPGIVNDNLLVITQEPTYIFEDPELFGDAIWEVEGTVQRLVFVEAIDTFDLDFEADLVATYEGAPVIFATRITLYED